MNTLYCPRCKCMHHYIRRILNRFEELLLGEEVGCPDEGQNDSEDGQEGAANQVQCREYQCGETISTKRKSDLGTRNIHQNEAKREPENKQKVFQKLRKQNAKQPPKKSSLRELLKKVASTSTAGTETGNRKATPFSKHNILLEDYPSTDIMTGIQTAFSTAKKSKQYTRTSVVDSERNRKSVEKHIARYKNRSSFSDLRKDFQQHRKGSELIHRITQKLNPHNKSRSVSNLGAFSSSSQRTSQPSSIAPINTNQINIYNSLPTPPFMKQQKRNCTFNDNRCCGFNCGSPKDELHQVVFDDCGHIKARIYK